MSNHYEPKEQDLPKKTAWDVVNFFKCEPWNNKDCDGFYHDHFGIHHSGQLVCTIEEFNQRVVDMSEAENRIRLSMYCGCDKELLTKESSDYSYYEQSKLRLDFFLGLGLKLVAGDSHNYFTVESSDVEAMNRAAPNDSNIFIESFAPRKNTGVQPCGDDVPVVIEYYYNHKDFGTKLFSPDEVMWSQKSTYKSWKPCIESLIKMQNEHDAKQPFFTGECGNVSDEKENEASKNLLQAVMEQPTLADLEKTQDEFYDELIQAELEAKQRAEKLSMQEQLKFTPEIAMTHTQPEVDMLAQIEFECKDMGLMRMDFTFKFETEADYAGVDKHGNATLVSKKEFIAWHSVDDGIKSHVFSDKKIKVNTARPVIGEQISIYMPSIYYEEGKYGGEEVAFTFKEKDAIAIANHFNLIK